MNTILVYLIGKTKQIAMGQFNFSDYTHRINVISMLARATCDVEPTLGQCRTHWDNVDSMLDQCHEKTRNTLGQRWPNTLGQHWADEQNYIGPTSFANIGPM